MTSDPSTVEFIVEQASRGNDVRARKMFGEYGVYCGEAFVGIVADDTLYLKVTDAGSALVPDAGQGSPYPGAKPHLIIEDADRLSELLRVTAAALPASKPRR